MVTLSPEERSALLSRARAAAGRALGLSQTRPLPLAPERLREPGAVHVAWKREGRLRGTAGSVETHACLVEAAEAEAVVALLKDPRFPPCSQRDFPRVTLEISVIGPLEAVTAPSEIEIGRHGVAIRKGARRSYLLPEAPLAWGWDAERLLEQLCLKAGLPGTGWREGAAAVYRFEAETFDDRT